MNEPVWIVVRATVNRGGRPPLHRDHVATVDATDPDIQHELRAGWIIPLPADQQLTQEQIAVLNEQLSASNRDDEQVK